MADSLWIQPIDQYNEGRDGFRPKPAKISFSNKVKITSRLPNSGTPLIDKHKWFQSRHGVLGKPEKFFARIAGFPEEGVKWIAENVNRIKLNVKRPEDVARALEGRAQWVSVPRKRERRPQLRFLARVADSLDPETKEQLEEVKENVVDTAQKARVPLPSTTLPYIGFVSSLTIKDLVCGILAGAAAATLVVPFDVLRTRVIAGQGGQTSAQVFDTVIHKEGLQSLMKGDLKLNVVKNAVEKGLQFATFESVKRFQEEHQGEQKRVLPLPKQIPVATAGGAAGGFVGTLLGYPLMPVFDRLLLQPDKYKSIQGTAMEVLRNEGGLRELYRGITPALISIVPTAAFSFYTYETLKKRYLSKVKLKPHVEALRNLVIGGIAGAVSTAATYPLELARKEILLSALSSKAVQFSEGRVHYNNTWQAVNGIAKAEGLRGLYRGLTAQTLQIVPMTAITFMVFELAKRAFVASGEEKRDELKDIDDVKD